MGAFSQGQKDPAALEILQNLSNKYKSYPSFEAEFVYSLVNPDNTKEDITGKVVVKGDNYKLDLGEQVIINNGETVWTHLKDVNEVNISDFYPEDQEISVSNIFTIYEEGYKYVYVENKDGADVVDLEPEEKGKDIYKIRMEIKSNSELKSFTMHERSGVKYVYTIKEFKADAGVQDSYFSFDEENFDGDIIDFRN